MPKPLFITLIVALPIVIGGLTQNPFVFFLTAVLVALANPTVRALRRARYFRSQEFLDLRGAVSDIVAEHNEVVAYVSEIRATGAFEIGSSTSAQHAHLSTFQNTSAWNYTRDRNAVVYAPQVHNASLQVVRNASQEPIKYLMKHFQIRTQPQTLATVQRVADDIARLEAAIGNVRSRELEIATKVDPPEFIMKYYADEFWSQIGATLNPIEIPYPHYKFLYVSAGGNSSQEAPIRLDSPTLEVLAETLAEKIRWTQSAAGQRALMTARLRSEIQRRDHHTCRYCGVSVATEPNLLLEVDHITPLSRGGLSVPENLQTLCWRCNRRKGAKLVVQ
ncbi:HNH endonuclease [uncultured Microbacterium sp.]|uniref:HNH endonuclease n=1 Tax=uncultured Microbacterium sp. TaxID=191216 RepID=UPI00263991AF|nr:HNH endonuclease [uncultured Microbacterium sp.]